MNSSTLSSAIESSPASSRSSSGRTGRVRAMMVVLMKSVTARATSSGSSRERFPVDISEFTILMRLLLCKSYEMPPSAGASNGPGGDDNEARQRQDPGDFDAGLAVGFGPGRERPGAVAGGAARAGRTRRSRPLRAPGSRPSRRLAFRSGPWLAVRASPRLLVPVLRLVVDGRARGDAGGAHRHRRQLSDRAVPAPGRRDHGPVLLGLGAVPGVPRRAAAARGAGRSGHAAGRLAASAASRGRAVVQRESIEED